MGEWRHRPPRSASTTLTPPSSRNSLCKHTLKLFFFFFFLTRCLSGFYVCHYRFHILMAERNDRLVPPQQLRGTTSVVSYRCLTKPNCHQSDTHFSFSLWAAVSDNTHIRIQKTFRQMAPKLQDDSEGTRSCKEAT